MTSHLAMLAAFLLAFGGLRAAPPAWVANQGTDAAAFPGTTYLTGFGLSSTPGDEARQRREATAMAREALASTIRTHISSEFEQQTVRKDQAMARYARTVVRTRSGLELEGLDRYEYHLDARKGTTYCLAVLERARMAKHLRESMAQRARECTERFTWAKAARDASGLLEAARLARRLEESRVVYHVVASAPPPDLPFPGTGEIGEELRRIYAASPGLDGRLDLAAYDLGAGLPGGLRVLVGTLHYEDTKFSGTFAAYAEQAVSARLAAQGNARILDKAALRDILGAQGPEVDMGQALQAQAVIHGTYFDLGSEVKLTLRATSVEGEELAAATVRIPAAKIHQAKLTLRPDNYAQAKKLLEIGTVQVQDSALRIKLAADRGDGGLYRKGDKLYLFLKANLDCYAKIIYHQVDGTPVVIFPNAHHPDSRILKDRLYQIPPSATAFSFEVVPPFGTELIRVMASTKPLELGPGEKTPEGFQILKGDPSDLIGASRGIAVTLGEALYAEDTVVINTQNRMP